MRSNLGQNGLRDLHFEVKIEPKWVPEVSSGTPWTPLGRFGDHVGSFGGFWVALWSSWGALWELWGGLWELFGAILGAFWDYFLMDSGAFFGSQARPIMKRCFLGSQTTFCCFLYLAENAEIAPTRKNPMYLQLVRVILEALVSLFLSLFSFVFLNYLDVFLDF